jgi:transposase
MVKGKQDRIDTPGYNKRRNVFVTLFWPSKEFVYNTFGKRRSKEFKAHLSNVIAYAKRQEMKKVILFVDHATYHKAKNVRKFIKEHPMLKVKFLPKRAPHLNPVEKLVNAPMKSVVCSNRCYYKIDELVESTHKFLRKHKHNLCT